MRKFWHKLIHPEVNRPLSKEEREDHLPQSKPSPIPVAWPQLSVIRMNSTFLECVDLAFQKKGFATAFGVFLGGVCIYIISLSVFGPIKDWYEGTASDPTFALIFGSLMILPFSLFAIVPISFLLLESFNYTHYPMIFNRKTRMVHVFLPQRKGEILSVPWDELYFSFTRKGNSPNFRVGGHKLAVDGETVLETFWLPTDDEFNSPFRFLQWEFVRQYMEGNNTQVAALANTVMEVASVDGRRETVFESFWQAWASFGGRHLHIALIASPLILATTIGRQIAMWTSKKPRWPKEILDTCQFSPNDPNLRDRKHLVPRHEVTLPDVSAYTGR